MQYLGIDWAYRRAAWCARSDSGAIVGEGFVPADEDGLVKLVLAAGTDVRACVEMMSGAIWVRERLVAAGWEVQVAHAGKVRDVAPLACKTDKVDARVLSELCRRDLVPALWVPSLDDRALRERLRRRMHLVGLRASAQNRIFGLLTQWGMRVSIKRLREPDAMEFLGRRGVEETWRRDRRSAGGHRPARRADRPVARRVAATRPRRPTCRASADHPRGRRAARPDAGVLSDEVCVVVVTDSALVAWKDTDDYQVHLL
jgi:transposase